MRLFYWIARAAAAAVAGGDAGGGVAAADENLMTVVVDASVAAGLVTADSRPSRRSFDCEPFLII